MTTHPLAMDPDERASTFDGRYATANRIREATEHARTIAALGSNGDTEDTR